MNRMNKLNHFTTFSALKGILKEGMRFSTGCNWQDKNDAELLALYREITGNTNTGVLCLLNDDETVYHWTYFSKDELKEACCVELKKKELLQNYLYNKDFLCQEVQYDVLKEVKFDNPEELLFTKRYPYRFKHFRDGTDIPIGEKDQYDNALPLVYERVAPGYDSKIYGLYYNWPAVNDDRGLCPQGWHVPSDDEWTELVEYVGSKTDWYCYMNNPKAISKALASPNGWIIDDDEGTPGCKYDDNNATGFSAIPAGNCNWLSQGFCCAGYSAEFWSSTKVESYFHDAWVRSIKNDCENVFHYENHMDDGLSVRCLRD